MSTRASLSQALRFFSTTDSTSTGSSSSTAVTPTTTPTNFTAAGPSLLDAFRDPLSREERVKSPPGRSWHARELRRKSFDDLHRLWLVLYKERNMLLTEQQLSRRHTLVFPHSDRLPKVQKSMGAIKQVLGERKRDKIAQVALQQMQQAEDMLQEMAEMEMEEEEEENATATTTTTSSKEKEKV